MAFLLPDGEAQVEFALCCNEMRRAVRLVPREEPECAPFVDYTWPPRLNGCDADIQKDPIRFCPWCGTELRKLP